MVGDREVTVRLKANIDEYKRDLKQAAAETAGFAKSADASSKSLGDMERNSKRTGNEIDKLSGRLRLAADAALILGPALVPIGAATVGGVVALSAQLGALAGGLGVTILAVNGLGDGLKALDEYQLHPTAENLAKLNEEMQKLGPSGESFVRFLDTIEPDLKSLQTAARDGLLPGAQEGIESLLTLLPRLRSLVGGFARELGGLAADAGEALAGDKYTAFFDYLQTDGVSILDDTARTIGNLTGTVANLFVAFAPLTGDFSGGLLEFTQGLEDASANLSSNQGFIEFLDYIETEGPHAFETLGSLANAILQIVEATAPLGGPVLTALSAVADAIAAIADSDLGTPLFAGLAALALYTRALNLMQRTATTAFGQVILGEKQLSLGLGGAGAATKTFGADLLAVGRYGKLATESSSRLSAQAGKLGRAAGPVAALSLAASGLADSTGLSNTAMLAAAGSIVPGWGTAIGAAAGYALDFRSANGKATESIDAFNAALAASQGNILAQQNAIDGLRQQAAAMADDIDTDSFGEFFQNVFDPDVAVAFTRDSFGMKTADEQVADAANAAQAAHDNLLLAQQRVADGATAAVGPLTYLGFAIADNAGAAEKEADALLQSVNAMREKRAEALRALDAELNYQAAIDDANKSIKENGRNFDITTEKGRANRQTLYALADGWNQQSDAAKNAKGSLAAARSNFIETAKQMGATAAQAKRLADRLFEIPPKRHTEITADTTQADAALRALKARMDAIKGKTVNVIVNTVRPQGGQVATDEQVHNADGGSVPKSGRGYADRYSYLLADGEEVISNRHGQADRHRSLLKAINAGRLADGGTAGNPYTASYAGVMNPYHVEGEAQAVSAALKRLKAALEQSEKALDKEKQKREDLIAAEQAFMSAVGGAYSKADLFSGGLSEFDTGLSANINDTNSAQAALAAAAANGLDGPLYQALAQSGNLSLVQQFAGLSAADIQQREDQFASQSAAQTGLGAQAADVAGFTQAIKDTNQEIREARKERRELTQAVKDMQKRLPDSVEDGARKGVSEREKRTHAHRRTGG